MEKMFKVNDLCENGQISLADHLWIFNTHIGWVFDQMPYHELKGTFEGDAEDFKLDFDANQQKKIKEVWKKNCEDPCKFRKTVCEWFDANDADKDCKWNEEEFINAFSNESNKQFILDIFGTPCTESEKSLKYRFKSYDVHETEEYIEKCDVIKIHFM